MKKKMALLLVTLLLFSGCKSKVIEDREKTSETMVEKTSESVEKPTVEEWDVKPTEEPAEEPVSEVIESAEDTETSQIQEAPSPEPEATPDPFLITPEEVYFNSSWEFGEFSVINTGCGVLYRAKENRKNIVIGINPGHGTAGGEEVRTQCHPDGTPKVTGGTNAEGSVTAMAVSSGMTFSDGIPERDVTVREAIFVKDMLMNEGYDVLMIRESEDVQLDNVARTVMCNNIADCHIAIHWDGDGLSYDKGCYYMSVPDGIKNMYPVSVVWQEDNRLGDCLISGLTQAGCEIFEGGSMQMDLTQTSFSSIPTVDIELGNQSSDHSDEVLINQAKGIVCGINLYFGF